MIAEAAAPEPRRRLFFALWPDDDARARLAKIARKALRGKGRLVPEHNLHLTLAFLGAVSAGVRECMEARAAAIDGEPFALEFTHLGYWPRPRVAWSGCGETPEALDFLVTALRRAMSACGLAPESRPYRAHLTCLRKAALGPGFAAPHPPVRVAVQAFHLLESKTWPRGAEYKIVRSFTLEAPSPRLP